MRPFEVMLDNVLIVALALLVGGIILLFIDRWLNPSEEKPVTYPRAFWIGCWQCIALIPGVSRSAATIIGGMANGLTRQQAAEFSFFLAVPTMFAASVYKVYTGWRDTPEVFSQTQFGMLLLGNAVAFVVAALSIRFLISFLQRHGFRLFGWYRIALGLVLLIMIALGIDLKMV
jgi:undecaprenyl-diphosphatase